MQTLELIEQGPLWRLRLRRPAVRNAFDDVMLRELAQVIGRVRAGAPRVLVLEGAGPCFCAGADLAWMQRAADLSEAENAAEARELASLFAALDLAPCICIARVHGAAMGGALGLIACADIVLAADTAHFAFRETRLGLVPAVVAPFVLRKIGAGAARRYFVTGETFGAAEALRLGLVHELVPEGELEARVSAVIDAVEKGGPEAVLAAKALIREVGAAPDEAACRGYTTRTIAALRIGREGQEGLRAFLEKRAPRW